MLNAIASELGVEIISMESDKDHIHMLISCRPQHYIPSIVKAFKGHTARFLFKEFPVLKKRLWGGHLRNPSYFISTVSDTSKDQIKAYIASQKTRSHT